jgi:hypothetical protein
MKESAASKLESITAQTLAADIGIAKKTHWAQPIDCRSVSIGKAVRFTTTEKVSS